MTPQTTAEWQRQIDSLAWLKRQFPKTWRNTAFQFEVGDRVALPETNNRGADA